MAFRPRTILILGLLPLMAPWLAYAQDQPLRVEVTGDAHHSLDPINIIVTNVASMPIDLAVPANILKNRDESFRNPLPIDVERHSGDQWLVAKPNGRGGIGRTIKPGQTLTFTLGIGGVGEYRARVWYVLDRGDPNPPARKPAFGSVLSPIFEILPGG